MKGFGLRPLPAAMASMARPDATECHSHQGRSASASRDREFVAVLDQEPVCALAPFPVVGHADQDEAAMQPLALQR